MLTTAPYLVRLLYTKWNLHLYLHDLFSPPSFLLPGNLGDNFESSWSWFRFSACCFSTPTLPCKEFFFLHSMVIRCTLINRELIRSCYADLLIVSIIHVANISSWRLPECGFGDRHKCRDFLSDIPCLIHVRYMHLECCYQLSTIISDTRFI